MNADAGSQEEGLRDTYRAMIAASPEVARGSADSGEG